MIERLKTILEKTTGEKYAAIELTSDLKKDLGLSSLDLAELACEIEDEFDVEIPDENIKDLKTVQNVVDLINSL